MSELLLIDDDSGQLATQVRQAFPAADHYIAVARTGAEGVARVRAGDEHPECRHKPRAAVYASSFSTSGSSLPALPPPYVFPTRA